MRPPPEADQESVSDHEESEREPVAAVDQRASPPTGTTSWSPVSASIRGSAHIRRGAPNQDAVAVRGSGPVAVIAVADGHGDPACPRSDRGSRLAADLAVDIVTEVATSLVAADPPLTGRPEIEEKILDEVVRPLVARWRAAVLEDADRDPLSDDEVAVLRVAAGEENTVIRSYGTTLLTAAATPEWIVLAQVGDGEIGVVLQAGTALQPIVDDEHVGTVTASMASADPVAAARVAALSCVDEPVAVIWACTDGFSGAQADPDWRQLVASQLLEQLQLGQQEVADRLPGWLGPAAETAGDDTSMAILLASADAIATAGPLSQPSRPRADVADERDTLPPTKRLTSAVAAPAAAADEQRPSRRGWLTRWLGGQKDE